MAHQIKCRTLLGHNNLAFSIDCLKSFIDHSKDEIILEVFQDGSLTETDKIVLNNTLENCVIIEKKDREEIALEKLAKFPNCLKWRTNNFYSAKFFDIMLYNNEDFLYVDSDIIFLQKFQFANFNETPVFMVDSYTTYSFSPLDFLKIKVPIFRKINAGFNYFPNKLFDVDFIEGLLSDPFLNQCFYGKWCGVAEQTLWAFLAARLDSIYLFDPIQVVMAEKNMKITNETIAIHLTRPFRYKYEEIKSLSFPESNVDNYKRVRLKAVSKYMNKFEFATEWVMNKFESKLSQL